MAEMFGRVRPRRRVPARARRSSSPSEVGFSVTRWRCVPGSATSRSSAATSTPPRHIIRACSRTRSPHRVPWLQAMSLMGRSQRSPAAASSSSSPSMLLRAGLGDAALEDRAVHADAAARRSRLPRRPERRRRPGAASCSRRRSDRRPGLDDAAQRRATRSKAAPVRWRVGPRAARLVLGAEALGAADRLRRETGERDARRRTLRRRSGRGSTARRRSATPSSSRRSCAGAARDAKDLVAAVESLLSGT